MSNIKSSKRPVASSVYQQTMRGLVPCSSFLVIWMVGLRVLWQLSVTQNWAEQLIHQKTVLPFKGTLASWRNGLKGASWCSTRCKALLLGRKKTVHQQMLGPPHWKARHGNGKGLWSYRRARNAKKASGIPGWIRGSIVSESEEVILLPYFSTVEAILAILCPILESPVKDTWIH